MENTDSARPPAPQLAMDLAGGSDPRYPPEVNEAASVAYAAWSAEEIVGLHFILLDDLHRLAEPETPLEERFELLEWVFTDSVLEDRPFSFRACVRLYLRTCDPDTVREELRRLSHAWLRTAVADLPAWFGARILSEPQWAATELHRNPRWINEALRRRASEPDLFGALPPEGLAG